MSYMTRALAIMKRKNNLNACSGRLISCQLVHVRIIFHIERTIKVIQVR